VIYEDAYRFFGSPEDGQGPQSLETVVFWSVIDNKPNPESVERVIRQIYTDLYRWFYRSAVVRNEAAMRFYRARLRQAMGKWWIEPWRVELRRDLLWLLCSHDDPGQFENVAFLDPCDYLSWTLKKGKIPQTLVGRSHGDLHGRNIFVGVQRREAEYAAVFDYGEMSSSNVLVWDFVKLETELKARLLSLLYEDREAQDVLFNLEDHKTLKRSALKRSEWPSAHLNPHSLRALQLEFAFKFESVLALLTERIDKLGDPQAPEPPAGRNITGNAKLDRALCILLRIRQEAALFLGEKQLQRGKRGLWKDAYNFALAVYGVSTAKFDYKESESAFALVSAGVAAAHTDMARDSIRSEISAAPKSAPARGRRGSAPYPSYHVPLANAHRLWKGKRTKVNLMNAIAVLDHASRHFGHSVLLLQEYALLLAEAGDDVAALKVIGSLNALCRVFRDEETLSRIGRTCKDLGDHTLTRHPVRFDALADHPAWQWYNAAKGHYREAFEICKKYYPGANAATLALICGARDESRALAECVLALCRNENLSAFQRDERFWLLVTEGEVLIVLAKAKDAAKFYRQALSVLPAANRGMAQSAYIQVCRLSWALGEKVRPVVEVFRNSRFRLDPGLLGDCGAAQEKR